MSETRRHALLDIQAAYLQDRLMNPEQLWQLLEINPNDPNEAMDKLFNVAIHPNILALSDQDRWAAIKTCQVVIGRLFSLSSFESLSEILDSSN